MEILILITTEHPFLTQLEKKNAYVAKICGKIRFHISKFFQIILFNSLIQLVVFTFGGPSYSMFSSLVFGLCGMKEIIEYSEIQRTPCISFWTKS
jgi:hypothetical protein